jgi:hypothetical protein
MAEKINNWLQGLNRIIFFVPLSDFQAKNYTIVFVFDYQTIVNFFLDFQKEHSILENSIN